MTSTILGRRRLGALVTATALVLAALPLVVGTAASAVQCPSVAPAPLHFAKPQYIDRNRPGGEPVSIVAQDGSILVSAHGGTTHLYKDPTAYPGGGDYAGHYSNQTLMWRSTNDGKAWKYL